jgi:gliding motility-associated-like protein
MSASFSVIQPDCNISTGSITINSSTIGLTFSLDGAPFVAYPVGGFIGLSPGTHTLQTKNLSICLSPISSILINAAPIPITDIVVDISDASCGNNTGSITISTVAGGLAPYQYSVDGNLFSSQTVYANLAAGAHVISVKGFNGCGFTKNIIINNKNAALISVTGINAICGAANGSITATSIGGTAPYQYSIDGINFQASNIFGGLLAGPYLVSIKDASGCINSTTINISNLEGATVTATSINASCGASNGSITATGTGGTAPYEYSIDGINYQASNVFTGLVAGNYSISIKDANGCSNAVNAVIANSNGATVTATSINASCGASNGSITATGTGGTSPYQYSIDGINYQASNVFTGLAAGNYTISIKDANGCSNTVNAVIANSNGATVTVTSISASCGTSNGSITATGTGGTAPYQYSIDGINYRASNVFTGLAAGNYSISIKDANGCSNAVNAVIANSNGATVTATSISASCGTSNGSITATGTGGTSPYQYSIDGINYQASNVFTGLAAGIYTIFLRDANGCNTSTTIALSASGKVTLTTIASDAGCTVADGTITATGNAGVLPYQYSKDGIQFQTTNIFSGLSAGLYTITIKDAMGCTTSQSVTINNTNPVIVSAGNDQTVCPGSSVTLNGSSNAQVFVWSPNVSLTNAISLDPIASPITTTQYILTATIGLCNKSDTVTVTVLSVPIPNAGKDTSICFGTPYQLRGSGGGHYTWHPANFLSNPNISNPVFKAGLPGLYVFTLSVFDDNGCAAGLKDSVYIQVGTPIQISAGKDTSISINQPLQLQATDISNGGIINYTWSPSFGLNNPSISNPLLQFSTIGNYTYTVTGQTAEGCTASSSLTIKVMAKAAIYVPNAFTPNGDGHNDLFKPIPAGIRDLKFFKVFNRWGEMVFSSSSFNIGWDGNFNGKPQDPGTFVWMYEAVDYNGNILAGKGIVILIR